MNLVLLSPDEVQKRWADFKHLRDTGGWLHDKVPSWIYDVLRDHYGGDRLEEIGIGAMEHAALLDMVESLLHARAVDALESNIPTCGP